MLLTSLFASTLLGLSFVTAAPTSLDAATLLQNGQEAQELNAEFQQLNRTDPCSAGQAACISGAFAQCTMNGTWTTTRCQSSQKCFALPSVRNNGTVIRCTSESSALSIMTAVGVQGGVISENTDTNNSTIPFPTSVASPNVSSPPNSMGQSGTSHTIITLTITVNPGETTTLPSETLTLAPGAASSLLSSIIAAGGSAATTIVNPQPSQSNVISSAAAPDATAGGDDGAAAAVNGSGFLSATTITLTSGPRATAGAGSGTA